MAKRPATLRKEAIKKIEDNKELIGKLWKECEALADLHRISFSYTNPDGDSGGDYYPPKPGDWIDDVDWQDRGTDRDPNRDHPEYEEYHPWDDGYDGWVSSSARC